jgi:hypothetical protein
VNGRDESQEINGAAAFAIGFAEFSDRISIFLIL